MCVKVWSVVVVNSAGPHNLVNAVGRYLTRPAAEKVAQAFRDAVYADPYNYWTSNRWNDARGELKTKVQVQVVVRIGEDYVMLQRDKVRVAQRSGLVVQDVDGQPIPTIA